MGAWSTSITGNDTASDLRMEYAAAFYKYDVEEALQKIDSYVRSEMFDESDPEEWCDYFYSLAHFMWKKGILTDAVRDKAVEMIDSDFGLELWAESGEKTLNSRKKKLEEFRTMLLSPQPAKKKIKPNVYTERIFEDGDIIAVQLQTANKPYTANDERPLSEEEFHAMDGKYVLMQLVRCYSSWQSRIVPEVNNYWAIFRLFDGIYDTVPTDIDFTTLLPAKFYTWSKITPAFDCESNMFYFKRRKYQLLENRKDLLDDVDTSGYYSLFWGINKPWINPDSELISAMGKEIVCGDFSGTTEDLRKICILPRDRWWTVSPSHDEADKFFKETENKLVRYFENVRAAGGTILCLSFGRTCGVVSLQQKRVNNLIILPRYQNKGLGTALLDYAFSRAGAGAYIDVPKKHKILLHICQKIGLQESTSNSPEFIRMIKP